MIVLVRHGETEANAQRVLQLPDVPLSAVGRAQAERVAERIADLGVAEILCSDLLRARETADPLVARTQAKITHTPLLQERNFGDLRGTPYAALTSDPFAPGFAPPGGETWEAFYQRVAAAFAEIVAHRRRTAGNLVVVTHGFVCTALVQRHVQVEHGVVVPVQFFNTSITLLDPEPPHLARLINCREHLVETSSGAPA
ncbi:MAG TPA: histidine phosphatase family protein [Polyangiales bacterium]